MRYFAGIETEKAMAENAGFYLQSIPYDGTSTWGKGADRGFTAFMEALDNMEIYDIETDSEAVYSGVHILEPIGGQNSPEALFKKVYRNTSDLLNSGKVLTFFGGEHSISIGVIKAFYEKYPDISIVQLDAHADLRPLYMGSAFNHACALHDASRHADLLQVGIRSMDRSEKEFMDREKCFFAADIAGREDWMDKCVEMMGPQVYITIDLDVFDPGIMPSTGTPEPGGMDWYAVIRFLRKIFEKKQVLGWDLVELAPVEGMPGPDFLAAKLYYKMLSYKVKYNGI